MKNLLELQLQAPLTKTVENRDQVPMFKEAVIRKVFQVRDILIFFSLTLTYLSTFQNGAFLQSTSL